MKPTIKLAVDVQISYKAITELRKMGYDVVYRAELKEKDCDWINKAIKRGAYVFVSPDADIPMYLDRNNIDSKWIGLPDGISGRSQAHYIAERIRQHAQRLASRQIEMPKTLGWGK